MKFEGCPKLKKPLDWISKGIIEGEENQLKLLNTHSKLRWEWVFFDFRPRIRPEGSKILSRMHWWLMFKIRWRIDFSKYIWYTSLSDWCGQKMLPICEFRNIINNDPTWKSQVCVRKCHGVRYWLVLDLFSILITKLESNPQPDRIPEESNIPIFLEISKIFAYQCQNPWLDPESFTKLNLVFEA